MSHLYLNGSLCLSLLATMAWQSAVAQDEEEAEWFIDADIAGIYNDNVGRAERERDIIEDFSVQASIGLAYNKKLKKENAITLRGFFEAEKFSEVTDLSHTTLGAQFVYRWQYDRGFSDPFYQLNSTIKFDQYAVGQRDSTMITSQFIATKRLTGHVMGAIGFEYHVQESNGIVFDQKHARVFANADYSTVSGLVLYATYSYLHGDTWSSSQVRFCDGSRASGIFGLVRFSEAVEPDEAFNNDYCGNWIAYRLDADINMLTLGVNKAFGHKLSFDMSARHVIVNAEGPNEYSATVVNAGFLVRF